MPVPICRRKDSEQGLILRGIKCQTAPSSHVWKINSRLGILIILPSHYALTTNSLSLVNTLPANITIYLTYRGLSYYYYYLYSLTRTQHIWSAFVRRVSSKSKDDRIFLPNTQAQVDNRYFRVIEKRALGLRDISFLSQQTHAHLCYGMF